MYDLTSLEKAFQNQNPKLILRILKKFSLNDMTKNTYFQKSVQQGYFKVVKYFLHEEVDISQSEYSAIWTAESHSHFKILSLMIEKLIDEKKFPHEIRMTLLNRLATHNHFNQEKLLKTLYESIPPIPPVELEVCFSSACYFGKMSVVKNLIDLKVNIDALNGKPLVEAIRGESPKIIRYLLEKGANPKLNNDAAMIQASVSHTHLKEILQLISHGADISVNKYAVLNRFIDKGVSGFEELQILCSTKAQPFDNPHFVKVLETHDTNHIRKVIEISSRCLVRTFEGLIAAIDWSIMHKQYDLMKMLLQAMCRVTYDVSQNSQLMFKLHGDEVKGNYQDTFLKSMIANASLNLDYIDCIRKVYHDLACDKCKLSSIQDAIYYFNQDAIHALKVISADFTPIFIHLIADKKADDLTRLFELLYCKKLDAIDGLGNIAQLLTDSTNITPNQQKLMLDFATKSYYPELMAALITIFDYPQSILQNIKPFNSKILDFVLKEKTKESFDNPDFTIAIHTGTNPKPIVFSSGPSSVGVADTARSKQENSKIMTTVFNLTF